MPTPFSFDHVFRADSPATILASYFDPGHLAAQDVVAELEGRTVTETRDENGVLHTTWRVTSKRPLPALVRPFVGNAGRLAYFEAMSWRRADDACDLTVTPDILGGRVQIKATYRMSKVGEMQIKRVYAGAVTANIRLISGRIEREIVGAFDESMAKMAAVTQTWLDAHSPQK